MLRGLVAVSLILASSFAFAYEVLPAKERGSLSGYTRAERSMVISAESGGRVIKINYDMGDVSDGRPFAVIDPTFAKLKVDSLLASLKKLDAGIAKLENRVDYLKKEYDRSETLFKKEVETENRRDQAKQAFDQAGFDMESMKRERESVAVSLAEAKESLRRHYLKIPMGWQISDRGVEAGELISAGQVIGKAGDYRSLIVPLVVTDGELASLREMEKIRLTVNGAPAEGVLDKVSPAFDERSRKRKVEIRLILENGLGGMLVDIPVAVNSDGIMVHKDAVVSRYANPKVKLSGGRSVDVKVMRNSGDMLILVDNPELPVGTKLEAVK